MPKYKFLSASLGLSSHELGGITPPPHRRRQLDLEEEMVVELAKKADVRKFCADVVKLPEFSAVNMDDARRILIEQFRKLIVLTGREQVVLNGGSQPVYRKLPDGSHWTEDWLQVEDAKGTPQPWAVELPAKPATPTHRVYPCLRVLVSAPF